MQNETAILNGWYLGELGGAALFGQLARLSDTETAPKWSALERVERRVAGRLAEILEARGVAVPHGDRVDERARERVAAIHGRGWPETMRWLRSIAAEALEEMRAEAERLPADLTDIGALVLRHEEALIAFAERELAGDGAHSLQPIDAFLSADERGGPA
jgi:hypothetical protein